jgi:hypothetical protein
LHDLWKKEGCNIKTLVFVGKTRAFPAEKVSESSFFLACDVGHQKISDVFLDSSESPWLS